MSEWTDHANEAAQAKGLELHRPAPHELFVDIDSAEDLAVFHRTIGILGDLIAGHDRTPSPSGRPHRHHIRVRLSRPCKDDFERIALQLILGSVRVHEAMSWAAAARGVTGVTVFFEKKASKDSP